jgi:hypothetical protein
VHRDAFVRTQVQAYHTHLVILEFHFVVLRVYLYRVLRHHR